jgi:hypothetical protein
MKMMIFAVYDAAVNAYMQPFFCRSTAESIRSFTTAVNESGNQMNKYAKDYTLFRLGVYDDQLGVFENNTPMPERMVTAFDVLAPDELFPESKRIPS